MLIFNILTSDRNQGKIYCLLRFWARVELVQMTSLILMVEMRGLQPNTYLP